MGCYVLNVWITPFDYMYTYVYICTYIYTCAGCFVLPQLDDTFRIHCDSCSEHADHAGSLTHLNKLLIMWAHSRT